MICRSNKALAHGTRRASDAATFRKRARFSRPKVSARPAKRSFLSQVRDRPRACPFIHHWVALLCAGLVVGTVTLGAAQVPNPNVIFITIDTLRADHLGCYGNPQVHTPHIDRLAREGARFTRAYRSEERRVGKECRS